VLLVMEVMELGVATSVVNHTQKKPLVGGGSRGGDVGSNNARLSRVCNLDI
jgi:hypothetical protein